MRENIDRRISAKLLAFVVASAVASVIACAGNPPAAAPSEPDSVSKEAAQQAPTAAAHDHSATGHSHGTEASVPRMTAEELHASMARGEVLVVDVRNAMAYAAAHIPGAVHLSLAGLEARLQELPQGKKIVTYCT